MSQTTDATIYDEDYLENANNKENEAGPQYSRRIYIDKLVLQQYRQLCREIAELEAEKEQLAAGGLGSSWQQGPKVSGGSLSDPTAQYAGQLWRLSSLLADRLNQLIALREAIEQAVSSLLPEERRLLRLFYIQGHSAEDCAQLLQYSLRHFWRRHQRTLQKLAEAQGVYPPIQGPQDWFAPSPQPVTV